MIMRCKATLDSTTGTCKAPGGLITSCLHERRSHSLILIINTQEWELLDSMLAAAVVHLATSFQLVRGCLTFPVVPAQANHMLQN
jgi:hypothetical protein